MKKMLGIFIVIVVAVVIAIIAYYLTASAPVKKPITWGVDFSQAQAENLNLNWKKVYLALLEDLGVRHIKLHTQWDLLEPQKGEYIFADADWQLQQAAAYGADVIYVAGMKTGRWPECHIPVWAQGLSKEEQQSYILAYVEKTVRRYKNNPVITAWQAENEPLFNFGICPWNDQEFLKKEVDLIKKLDPTRPVIISDSGEQSMWFGAARIGDMVGATTYRTVWVRITNKMGFYFTFPIPPKWYGFKASLVQWLFGKKVIGVELQAEPWAPRLFYDVPLDEQEKSMNFQKFKEHVAYAKKTGLDTFYFWGVEWWYWLKESQGKPEIWNEAKSLFVSR